MSKISDIIEEVQKTSSGRKTKNNDIYYQILMTLCSDEDYTAKIVTGTKGKDLVTEDLKLAPSFKKIVISILKKATNMSEAEASDFADSFKLSADQAKTIAAIVHETDYIAMKDCNKKVQLFKKPELDVAITIERAKESVRPNPADPSKSTKIAERDRLKVQQKLYEFQKTVISTPKKKK